MIKIKNTNNIPTKIQIGTGLITMAPFQILEVDEVGLGMLPEGVTTWTDGGETQLLTEIDPHTDKKLVETPQDNINLLLEQKH